MNTNHNSMMYGTGMAMNMSANANMNNNHNTGYWSPFDEDKLGITVTSGQVKIIKDNSNLIGISIGGGAPYCPCLYIIQVMENSPVARDGTLQPGDEITAINGKSFKGANKGDAAQAIQSSKDHVVINYNKLHVDAGKSASLDIVLKKFKHRLTENMSPSTADALGFSRAILCNDNLLKRFEELERNEIIYSEIRQRTRATFKAFYDLNKIYRSFGDVMTEIGCREKQPQAGEAFRKFGEVHRQTEKHGNDMLDAIRSILGSLDTYIHKAIPDTKLTIKKYQDVKFEYLSYCLKVKEMDDEEKDYQQIQEPLYRVETGNYEYRLVLRDRQEARKRFTKLRSDVAAKIELLDQKHVQHLSSQLLSMIKCLHEYNFKCYNLFSECPNFPLELDLSECFNFDYTDEQDLTEFANQNSSDDPTLEDDNNNAKSVGQSSRSTEDLIDTTGIHTLGDTKNDVMDLISVDISPNDEKKPTRSQSDASQLVDQICDMKLLD